MIAQDFVERWLLSLRYFNMCLVHDIVDRSQTPNHRELGLVRHGKPKLALETWIPNV
jgi:hypothetical protein